MLDDRIGPSFRQSFPLLLHPSSDPLIIVLSTDNCSKRYRGVSKFFFKKNLRYIFSTSNFDWNKIFVSFQTDYLSFSLSIFLRWNEKFRENSCSKRDCPTQLWGKNLRKRGRVKRHLAADLGRFRKLGHYRGKIRVRKFERGGVVLMGLD